MRIKKPGRNASGLLIGTVAAALVGGAAGFVFLKLSAERSPNDQDTGSAQPGGVPPQVSSDWLEEIVPDVKLPLSNKNPGYVGAQVCGKCHAARLEEFRNTRHSRACLSAEESPLPEAWSRNPVITAPSVPSVRFQMSQSGNRLTETIIRRTERGETRKTLTGALVYGSDGMADEVYFAWKGTRLWELPVSWLRPRHEWGVQWWTPFRRPTDFVRKATTRCLECHNTWFEYVKGSENQYRPESFILGVTCERCHGPAQEHVNYHQAHPDATTPRAILNPSALSRERQLDVCAQCHSDAIYRRTPLFSYRPGDPLEKHFRILKAPGLEHDHVADQVGYLQQSECFQSSEALTCTTCHNPHAPTDPASAGNRSCAQCHSTTDCGEHQALPSAVRDQCVSCHMPRYNRVAVKFHTRDDRYVFPMRPRRHRIAVYPAARQKVLLDWYRSRSDRASRKKAGEIRDSLASLWRRRAEELVADHRLLPAMGALREAMRVAPTEEAEARLDELVALQSDVDAGLAEANHLYANQRFDEAVATLGRVLEIQPKQAVAHYRLGTILAMKGQHDRASGHLKRVADCDPANPDGENMLGWLAYLRGDAEQAVQAFQRADEIRPFTAEFNYRWGLSLLQFQRWDQAERRFRKVLQIHPGHAGGCQGLSHALRRQGALRDALRYAGRAARLSQFESIDILTSLADAYAANGQDQTALKVTRLALETASNRQPDLVPYIRSRLQALQSKVTE